jgi:hypothetical protein
MCRIVGQIVFLNMSFDIGGTGSSTTKRDYSTRAPQAARTTGIFFASMSNFACSPQECHHLLSTK